MGIRSGSDCVTRRQRQAAKALVTRAGEVLRTAGWKVSTFVGEGDPKSVILDQAAAWNADLVVVGSHGRKGLDQFLLGASQRPLPAMLGAPVNCARPSLGHDVTLPGDAPWESPSHSSHDRAQGSTDVEEFGIGCECRDSALGGAHS